MAHQLVQDTPSRVVTLAAQPEPIAIDTAQTVVIVVDMQNDFATKGGMLDRRGIDISPIQQAIGPPQTSWPPRARQASGFSTSRWAIAPISRTSALPTR